MKPRKTNPLSFANLAGIANFIGPAKPAAKKAPVSGRLAAALKSVGRGPTTKARTKEQVGTIPQKRDVAAPARVRTVDDDSAEEMRGTGPAAAARRRERERCQAIVGSPVGLRHPALAASLAFGSRLRRSEAIVLLHACDRPPQGIEQIASTLKTWRHSHA